MRGLLNIDFILVYRIRLVIIVNYSFFALTPMVSLTCFEVTHYTASYNANLNNIMDIRYLFLRLIAKTARFIPVRLGYCLAALFGDAIFLLSAKHRKIVSDN